ncbi:rubredoxin (plasmid) [Cupriavidus necator]|uniref:Rubredoxin n=1 Tax=Cupriavidus necator TaxID=106590 RepID=A0A1U9V3W2_CUPNE|nr:rubredoxin [Cupriavidus necator]AQV99201.1 rubredoxin [Cupriavidus necator]
MENQCASVDHSGAGAVFADFKVWQCALCGFIYDEAIGMPDEGIAPGTRWADIPDDWKCPECSVGKNDFEMVEV